MKFWLLERLDVAPDGCIQAIVIREETEQDARETADEITGWDLRCSWLRPDQASCRVIDFGTVNLVIPRS